jgi:hypothetical protein
MTAILRPGDTLVIATTKTMSDKIGDRYRENIEHLLPGIRIVVIAPVVDIAILPRQEQPS